MLKRSGITLKFTIVVAWLLFTVSLTAWWYIFTQEQIATLIELNHSASEQLRANQRMLRWEGAVLIACLTGGGVWIAYSILREFRQNEKMRQFFSTFSHDLKTPIASLRLQAEALKEDLPDSPHADRIFADTVRLNSRLENSLALANLENYELLLENLNVRQILLHTARDWPELSLKFEGDGSIKADRRACEAILGNILQNASLHGKASSIQAVIQQLPENRVQLSLRDDGKGFQGKEPGSLGEPFQRQYAGSGSGIGLYLIHQLAERLGGTVGFDTTAPGFGVVLTFREGNT